MFSLLYHYFIIHNDTVPTSNNFHTVCPRTLYYESPDSPGTHCISLSIWIQKKYFPEYWYVDFKDGRTSQKWSPDTFLVVFLTEIDFNFKIHLNFSFVSDIPKICKIILKFFLERLDCMNCMLFPINSAFPSPIDRLVLGCNAQLRFFCGPHYQLNNEYRQKIRLKIVCKNENDPISFLMCFVWNL